MWDPCSAKLGFSSAMLGSEYALVFCVKGGEVTKNPQVNVILTPRHLLLASFWAYLLPCH